MAGNRGSGADELISENDQPIESDIRHLRHLNTFLTILGTVVIIGFFAVLGYKYYMKAAATPDAADVQYLSIAFAANDAAKVFTEPDGASEPIAGLFRGQTLIVTKKQGDWRQVRTESAPPLVGWVRETDLHTKEQLQAALAQLEDDPVKLENIRFIVDEIDNFTIIGEVYNNSKFALRNIRIAIEFYDAEHRPVERKIRHINPDEPLPSGEKSSFFFTGKYQGGYYEAGVSVVGFE